MFDPAGFQRRELADELQALAREAAVDPVVIANAEALAELRDVKERKNQKNKNQKGPRVRLRPAWSDAVRRLFGLGPR